MHENKNVSRTYASFRITGVNLNPDEITEILDIIPYRSFKKGDKHGEKRWPHGYWGITSKSHVNSKALEVHITWLLDQLEPKWSILENMLHERDYHADVFCFWESKTGNGGPVFSPIVLGRLSALDLELGLDIYFTD